MRGGARPNTGGARPGAGRPKGTTSQLIEEARAIASPYAERAIKELAKLGGVLKGKGIKAAESEAARVQALSIILDRAYGKPKQPVEGEMLHGISEELRKFIASNAATNRAFIGFDQDDQDAEAETDAGPVQHH